MTKAVINVIENHIPYKCFSAIPRGHFFMYYMNEENPNVLMQKAFFYYSDTKKWADYAVRVSDGSLICFRADESVIPVESIDIEVKVPKLNCE